MPRSRIKVNLSREFVLLGVVADATHVRRVILPKGLGGVVPMNIFPYTGSRLEIQDLSVFVVV